MRAFNNKEISSSRLRVKHLFSNQGQVLEVMVNKWLEENHVNVLELDYFIRDFKEDSSIHTTSNMYCVIKYLI